MNTTRTTLDEAAEDLYFGQLVMIWARWFVIFAIAILAIWGSSDVNVLAARSLVLVALMTVNFFLHGRILVDRPANARLLAIASLIDLVIIGGIIAGWKLDGLASPYFVLYYPLIFAFALVFPPRLSALYTLIALASYVALCLLTGPSIFHTIEAKTIVERVITMATIAGLGAFYWRGLRGGRPPPPPPPAVLGLRASGRARS